MLIYFVVAALSSYCVYRASIAYSFNRRYVAYIEIALSVCMLCLIAGLRGLEVGTDVLVYGQHAFNIGIKYSLADTFSFSLFKDWGPIYTIYSWLAARAGRSMVGYQIGIQLLIVLPAFIAIWRANRNYAFVGVLVYCLFFFPVSLNMIRQSAAMSFILLSMVALLKSRWGEAAAWIVVAALIHQTAVICLVLIPLAYVFRNATTSTFLLLVLFLLLVFCAYPVLVDLLSNVGKYATYLTGSHSEAGGGRRLNLELSFSVILLSYFFCSYRRKNRYSQQLRMLFSFLLVSLAGVWLSVYSFYLYRIGFYFLISAILALPYCLDEIRDQRCKLKFELVAISLLVLIHFDYFILVGAHHVVPYVLAV